MAKKFPFANLDELLGKLNFQPLTENSPELGDVIKYRDGTVAIVGDSPVVSYGPREEMQSVARLFPREESGQKARKPDLERNSGE